MCGLAGHAVIIFTAHHPVVVVRRAAYWEYGTVGWLGLGSCGAFLEPAWLNENNIIITTYSLPVLTQVDISIYYEMREREFLLFAARKHVSLIIC